VADQQQMPVGGQAGQLGESLASVKASGQRRVHRQPLALLFAPLRGGQLRGLSCACLGAEQDGLEARLQPCQRDPGHARLAFTAIGQTALSVRTRAVRLCVSVT
jgi:hypothetical protein